MPQSQKVSIVTGGAQGIGKAVAHHLLGLGHAVVIADCDARAGAEAQAELATLGDVQFVETDVSREEDVARVVHSAVERHRRIDLLVNNAGILRNGPVTRLSLADWNTVIGVNLTGAFLCSRHGAPHLQATGGSIVNIVSTRALMSEPDTEAYSASKGGLLALTHALAMSLAPRVRVNAVSPGWIDTGGWRRRDAQPTPAPSDADHRHHPAGRVGRPEDVAALVAYLASDAAGFITAQNFVVDGGMTRKMIYSG